MKKTIAQFDIPYTQFLSREGRLESDAPKFTEDLDHLKELYRAMVRTRVFDAKAIALQRTGKLGTYPSTLGQEAIGVGIGVGIGLLIAPTSGEETRADLADMASSLGNKFREATGKKSVKSETENNTEPKASI